LGVDVDADRINQAKETYPKASGKFTVGFVDNLPHGDAVFDHILCCAVLDFAKNKVHFIK